MENIIRWNGFLTRNRDRAGMGRPGKANNFSTPPVSFQCIKRRVGGARSKVVTISDVSDNWDFISSPEMFLTSSTISLRFLLCRAHPVTDLKLELLYLNNIMDQTPPLTVVVSTGARANPSSSFWSKVVWSTFPPAKALSASWRVSSLSLLRAAISSLRCRAGDLGDKGTWSKAVDGPPKALFGLDEFELAPPTDGGPPKASKPSSSESWFASGSPDSCRLLLVPLPS